ncbi:YlbF family regulator [Levilactobacillus sp. N40-8-2]|uniref:YlbF family regulator n=1 Tax=Levilactobacillus muriae TaxID=3238987 RepID=UPI0038B30854
MADMHALGEQVAQTLQETQEFKDLQAAFDTMKADDETYKLFKEFEQIQMDLQQKQMTGQQPTDDDMKHVQEVAGRVSEKDAIKALMDKERGVNDLLTDLNKMITEPIQAIYKG